jgi:probable O-glycosylation ligase (exosortase A-associated)
MTITNIQQDTEKWFLFTILYIILDYARIYEVFNLGFIRPLLLLTLLLTFCILNSLGGLQYLKSKQTKMIWLFILLLACLIPFAKNPRYAYNAMWTQILYMPYILSVVMTVNSIERLKKFVLILICIAIYISVYAFTHAGYGPGNYFGDENDLSLYINMWIPFCYFLFFAYKKKNRKLLCLIGLIIGLLAVIVSFSRGGFFGLAATGIVIWLFSKKKLLSIFIIIILIGIMFLFAGEEYWVEMSTTTNTEEGTAKGRIESWKGGWNMFVDNPLGVGGNNYPVRISEYQTDYFQRGMYGRVAHSLWFTLIPELGLFGIYFYLALLYYNLKDIFTLKKISFDQDEDNENKKYLNFMGRAFIASFAGFFVSGTFISVLYYAHYWYMVALLVATTKIAKNYETDMDRL